MIDINTISKEMCVTEAFLKKFAIEGHLQGCSLGNLHEFSEQPFSRTNLHLRVVIGFA